MLNLSFIVFFPKRAIENLSIAWGQCVSPCLWNGIKLKCLRFCTLVVESLYTTAPGWCSKCKCFRELHAPFPTVSAYFLYHIVAETDLQKSIWQIDVSKVSFFLILDLSHPMRLTYRALAGILKQETVVERPVSYALSCRVAYYLFFTIGLLWIYSKTRDWF